jgi:hypothetical protein
MIAVLIPLVLLVLLAAISKLSVAKGYSIGTSGCGSGGGGPVMARIVPPGNTLIINNLLPALLDFVYIWMYVSNSVAFGAYETGFS